MSARHVIMFSARFAEAVARGEKRQTIRPTRKRAIAAGDELDLRAWSGLPYRSKQNHLSGIRVCVRVSRVFLSPDLVMIDDVGIATHNMNAFARDDGFSGWAEMRDWFDNTHGLPFTGVLIRW
jgi:hypothetical protein